ncbi:helix-turn-helix domain-containing protein [bacterium]|nr:helix-turn-helix domain-containing protein [bacterium]MBU1634539.1 helix-turn-helix domain-containing protein [bacterium]MBU1875322.1 helix-turn-helix domain-containing protein [bacterium]
MDFDDQILAGLKTIENKLNGVYSKWLTVTEGALYCRISESKMRKLIGSGRLPIHRIDCKILLNRRELDFIILTGSARPNRRQREVIECLL